MRVLLEARNVSAGYYSEGGFSMILRNVDLEVNRGDFVGIVGESGSGKSTLGLVLYNYVVPPMKVTEGEVLFEGRNLMRLSEGELRRLRGSEMAYVPQAAMNSLNPVKKVAEQFALLFRAHQIRETEYERLIRRVLDITRLEKDVLHRYPHELSGGMRQRVCIALAIALSPKMLVLDEPTTGLDVVVQHALLMDIKRIQQEIDATIVLISHDVATVYQMADSVIIMYGGEVVESGPYDILLNNPKHPYTFLLLQSLPSLKVRKEKLIAIPGSPVNFASPPSGCLFSPRCPYAENICNQEHPGLRTEGSVQYRCHLYPEWRRRS